MQAHSLSKRQFPKMKKTRGSELDELLLASFNSLDQGLNIFFCRGPGK